MSTIPDIAKNYYPISATLLLANACILSKPEDIENLAGTDYLLLAATELGFIATAAFGIIESIFWTSIFLLAKSIHVFMPESELADRIVTQIFRSTSSTIGAATVAALMVEGNFFMNVNPVIWLAQDLRDSVFIPFVENHLMGLINYRLFAESDIVKARQFRD